MTRYDFKDKLKTLTSLSPHINGFVHDGTKEIVGRCAVTAEKKDEVKYSFTEPNLIQDQLTKKIFKAVYANDIEAAREAIKDGINAKTADGNTPLHMSAICGYAELIKVFIEKGAPVNAKTADGNTPLHIAVRWGHTKAANLLKQHGGLA